MYKTYMQHKHNINIHICRMLRRIIRINNKNPYTLGAFIPLLGAGGHPNFKILSYSVNPNAHNVIVGEIQVSLPGLPVFRAQDRSIHGQMRYIVWCTRLRTASEKLQT